MRRRTSVGDPVAPQELAHSTRLLEVEDLSVSFATDRGRVQAVDRVSLTIEGGKTLGIVGESGCGKSVLSRSMMGLPARAVERSGSVRLDGEELLGASQSQLRRHWGKDMAMVFQDSMTSLNPVLTIGLQITESLRHHLHVSHAEANRMALGLLQSVGIPAPAQRLREYPHQLSGGMRQRIAIAIALSGGPRLLFADEPTTALDVTVQAQILDLLAKEQRERHMAMVLVTHDLGVVAGRTDEVAVMYAGQIVERAPTRRLFKHVRMPYTAALLKSIPRLHAPSQTRLEIVGGRPPDLVSLPPGCRFADRCPYAQPVCREEMPPLTQADAPDHLYRCWFPVGTDAGAEALQVNLAAHLPQAEMAVTGDMSKAAAVEAAAAPVVEGAGLMAGTGDAHLRADVEALLRVDDLIVDYAARGGRTVHAVSGISFDAVAGETLGIVGESGCGKSSTARALVQLTRPTSGSVRFDGRDLTQLHGAALRQVRPQMQLIFQDPISSLNPNRTVADIVAEPLKVWKRGNRAERSEAVRTVLEAVGLDPDSAGSRRANEFSGGQCQRICIARALVLEPKLIICDEPVSSLDVSIQAQILNLLQDLKVQHGLTLVFIAHDLAVVKNMSDRVMVMYLGKLCEVGAPDVIYQHPAHPYTAALLQAIPMPDPDLPPEPSALQGDPPSPVDPPSGCRFRTRCPRAQGRCATEEPTLQPVPGRDDQFVACHFPLVDQGAERARPL